MSQTSCFSVVVNRGNGRCYFTGIGEGGIFTNQATGILIILAAAASVYLICYYFKRGAIVIFAILLLFAVSGLQPAEAFRAKVLNIFTKDEVDATTIRPEDEELLKDWEDYWYPTYIPEGYALWQAVADDFRKILIFSAENDTDKIRLSSFDASSAQITHDTDNHEYKEISVGAYKGYLFSNEENQFLRAIWTTEKDLLMLESSGSLSEEDVLKMAESLNFIKK